MNAFYTLRFTALRMMRDYITLLLLLIVPLILVTIFSMVLAGAEQEGMLLLDETSVKMVLLFQLFGGAIVMSYIHLDFFTQMRFRIQALPMNSTMYGFTIMLAGTIYSIVLGLILIVYTSLVFDVEWGSVGWSIFIVSLIALLSINVSLIFTFAVKNFKIAERLSEVYGVGAVVLAGMFFPMPDLALINGINEYLNPLTIAYQSVDAYRLSQMTQAWQSVFTLVSLIVLTFVIMLVVGRRRMP
ncbi:ABC transporter permease [Shouchella patagoniensis]|uniref:ABC transporter permease n=1 Tax=Shouchella patagoniensis TaxID=228576 RepID=UPI0009954617|nr:ABC transporter permease [Shouchella patagoniensis]